MKKTELKKVLKPLIKECIKEVIFEDGVLSGIITEVAAGLSTSTQFITEKQTTATRSTPPPAKAVDNSALKEVRRKMLEEVNRDAYGGVNLFEGTEPLRPAAAESGMPAQGSPLSNQEPGDPGIDISGIMSVGKGHNWNKLVKG